MSRLQFFVAQGVVLAAALISAWLTNWFGLGPRNLEYLTSVKAPYIALQNDLGKRLSIKYNEQTLKEVSAADVDIFNNSGRDTKAITLRFKLIPAAAGQDFTLLEPYVLMPERMGDRGYERLADPEPGTVAFRFENIKQSGAEDYRYTVRFLFSGPNAAHIQPSTSEIDWDVRELPWHKGPNRPLVVGLALYVALIVFAIWGIVSSSRGRPYATAEKIWKHLKQRQADLKLTDGQIEDVVNSYLEGPGVKPGWLLRNRDKVAALLAKLRSGGDRN